MKDEMSSTSTVKLVSILNELQPLFHYANLIEKSLRNEAEEIIEFMKENENMPSIDEELWHVQEISPYLQRSAAFLSVFAFVEHNLNLVCETLREEYKRKLSFKDLNDKGLERIKNYMKKEIGIDFPDQTEPWNEIKSMNKIRNVIAHRISEVDPSDNKLIEYINKDNYFDIQNNFLQLQNGAIKYLLSYIEIFLKELNYAVCKNSPNHVLHTDGSKCRRPLA